MSRLLDPEDVQLAARVVAEALSVGTDRDWGVRAGSLDWSVRDTLGHAAGASANYALCLASQSRCRITLRTSAYPEATNGELLVALCATADALAQVAASAPPDGLGFHVAGMADAEGFIAMACVEILVHGWDAAQGLGLEFPAEDDLARRVVSRLFPWAPSDTEGWPTLLWLTARQSLVGQKDADGSWIWHCAPLEEWDGSIAIWRPIVEWVGDGGGRWRGVEES